MLLRSLAPVVLALARLVKADDDDGFSQLSSCGQNCVNNMRTSTGCVPVTDECLCSNQNFIYGITDCANSACTSSDAQAALDWADSWCGSVTASTSAAAATSTTAEASSATEAAVTADAATTSPEAAATTASESTAANAAAQTTASDSATSTPAAAETSVSGTSSADAAASTAANSDASSAGTGTATQGTSDASATGASSAQASSASGSSSSSSSWDSTESSGLSAGAKAGIVVGAAGAAIFVVGAVLYLSRKRKKPLPRGTMKISEPLPGSGRIGDDVWERYHSPPPFSPMYSSQQQQQRSPRTAGSGYSELDRNAKPYEDMVPRMTPTRMV